jgi:hypothetical protein
MKVLRAAIATTLLCLSASPSLADSLTGNLTEAQLSIIAQTTDARFAGTLGKCPRYRFMETASFAELKEAGITSEMIDSQYFKNAQMFALANAMRKYEKNPSDFCMAAWLLYGPDGRYKRQMLEKAD